jgi:large subunit ribosomal protein L21
MSDQETTAAVETQEPAPTVETPVAKPKGYAIIETGGKQYRVSVGDRISVERLPADAGGEINFDRVLLLGGDGATRIGMPVVDGASVTARVEDHFRGEKIIVFKYKAKKRYRRRIGHRQELTHLTITGIAG